MPVVREEREEAVMEKPGELQLLPTFTALEIATGASPGREERTREVAKVLSVLDSALVKALALLDFELPLPLPLLAAAAAAAAELLPCRLLMAVSMSLPAVAGKLFPAAVLPAPLPAPPRAVAALQPLSA